ncbi:MAG: hypothetical protein F6K53_28125 [Moorea sp. SIO4A1]|uniref:hypothetical protein n=1 Tax=Moorena sp. SIO4A1 TaxID=2607835 RepID=UPI0014180250|nr:hypothetical protein [Moorena sp. SIO4A1]NEO48688.1 hypothetical protein [Moorena sp. SIO4A3]NEQ61081.1 hypothetical protein [Moorena sp. SIO4A1]
MPTSTEREAQQPQPARLLFEQERQRSQRLAERLRAMGIDAEVSEALAINQVQQKCVRVA